MSPSPVPQGSIWRVLLGAATILVIAWFGVGYLFPEGGAVHHFRSPDRTGTLDLAETCNEAGCTRSAVLTLGLPDTAKRFTCVVPLEGNTPLLPNAVALWAETGGTLDVIYADKDGEGGRFTLDFAKDCQSA